MALHHLLVRSVHVLGMALLVGGSIAAWAALRWNVGEPPRVASGYEWLFWSVVGAMVATGVGNLGAMAPAVPGPGTTWGETLSLKLLVLGGLLVGSGIRVLRLVETSGSDARTDDGRRDNLRRPYAATAWVLVGLIALAEVLAHG